MGLSLTTHRGLKLRVGQAGVAMGRVGGSSLIPARFLLMLAHFVLAACMFFDQVRARSCAWIRWCGGVVLGGVEFCLCLVCLGQLSQLCRCRDVANASPTLLPYMGRPHPHVELHRKACHCARDVLCLIMHVQYLSTKRSLPRVQLANTHNIPHHSSTLTCGWAGRVRSSV
jgi:hypothetical protein